jgi:hypothetical protein
VSEAVKPFTETELAAIAQATAFNVYAARTTEPSEMVPASDLDTQVLIVARLLTTIAQIKASPVDMLLFCPRCLAQHIDRPQPEKGWDNPPHRSHECQACGHVWRPADVATNGVDRIETCGKRDGECTELMANHQDSLTLIGSPGVDNFVEDVKREAAHQVERRGTDHDTGKTHEEWFWLLGWLAGKAVFAARMGDATKLKHHIITTAAACLNWRRASAGESNRMRPGIAPPEGER